MWCYKSGDYVKWLLLLNSNHKGLEAAGVMDQRSRVQDIQDKQRTL